MHRLATVVDPADTLALRQALGRLVTGVAIVTASHAGEPVGMTVNSFTPVSLEPPLVSFCVRTGSGTGRQILAAGAFAVNVLSERQRFLAERFTGNPSARFAGTAYREAITGAPLLDDALASFDCRIVAHLTLGDHELIVGEVVTSVVEPGDRPALAYFLGSYNSVAASSC
ncbi:MAG TPA: flavin reductase family protein [Actinomycetota bacterium]|nr:flavin reductase family protein [Actinomycetota bacterium]